MYIKNKLMKINYANRLFNKNEHLLKKETHIFITNVCNLSCGGCHQMCGNIPKNKLFFTNLDDIEWMIDNLIKNSLIKKQICIFGGEPTLHPKFNELLEIISSKSSDFAIFTNGRLHENENKKILHEVKKDNKIKNLIYYIDRKNEINKKFIQTWNAPYDYYKIEDKNWYFKELAIKNCFIWNKCRSIVYNKYAYGCVNFPTMDILTGENHGWEMIDGEDVFVRTIEEIEEQAKNYCYRCGHCMNPANIQGIGEKTKVSPINLDLDILKKNIQIVNLELPFL
jgi:organic radical activating enzyme